MPAELLTRGARRNACSLRPAYPAQVSTRCGRPGQPSPPYKRRSGTLHAGLTVRADPGAIAPLPEKRTMKRRRPRPRHAAGGTSRFEREPAAPAEPRSPGRDRPPARLDLHDHRAAAAGRRRSRPPGAQPAARAEAERAPPVAPRADRHVQPAPRAARLTARDGRAAAGARGRSELAGVHHVAASGLGTNWLSGGAAPCSTQRSSATNAVWWHGSIGRSRSGNAS